MRERKEDRTPVLARALIQLLDYPGGTRTFVAEKCCPTSTWPLLQPHLICSHSVFLPRTLGWLHSHQDVALGHTRVPLLLCSYASAQWDGHKWCLCHEVWAGRAQGEPDKIHGALCAWAVLSSSAVPSEIPEDAVRKKQDVAGDRTLQRQDSTFLEQTTLL